MLQGLAYKKGGILVGEQNNAFKGTAMHRLSYGLFVVTTKDGNKLNGCITNTAIQVASDPDKIAVAVNKTNFSHDMILNTGAYNISVISEDADFSLFKHFGFQSGRNVDKFADYSYCKLSENGLPYITKGTNAYFSITVQQTVDLGSHTLFIGTIGAMEVLSSTPSATYTFYQENIKPKPEAVGKTSDGQTVWRCTICGYEYVGEELPENFICPICKHPASDFEKFVK
jgi:flavin reductase (DIM6/NTAB) family NADH-FMN oxidoreductase RutF